MSLNSKKKGNRGELALCKILKTRFPGQDFMRVPSSGAIMGKSNKIKNESAEMGTKEVLSGDLICPSKFKFSVESKFYSDISFWDIFNESSDLHNWMSQVSEDSAFVNKLPFLIVKINNHPHFAATTIAVDGYIFEHQGFYFYTLENLLTNDDSFFFK